MRRDGRCSVNWDLWKERFGGSTARVCVCVCVCETVEEGYCSYSGISLKPSYPAV